MNSDIPEKLLKPYNPTDEESRLYKKWEDSGYFTPENMIRDGLTKPDAKPYTIVLPPPNVTGVLHMGHAMMLTVQDILIRYHRMRGDRTLWLPGTDHAAIATQSVVEKKIQKEEGLSRHDIGREDMLKRIGDFATASHDTIVSQMKVMGASCDWSREAFTLDETRTRAVRTVFKQMYDDGLIYRGNRIVNWDPKGQTTISDDEIIYVEEKTKFYYLQYGPFVIGTARPETKFGDKYVVMHPDDARYATYTHGQQINLEWINGPIVATIIKDKSIDMEFGTGVMTITPWHSVADFEIAERHNLEKEQIIDKYGKLLPVAGEFAGMKITEARSKIIEKLREKGLVEKEEPYTHNIATAERTNGIIEPQVMLQWFIDVNKPITQRNGKTLKQLMREPVENNAINIIPDFYTKTYFHWIDNLRDWCISRQIWYGHRIPVWYKNDQIYTGTEAPSEDGWTQDEDTLDTWFSSALWTFSTLGWPEQTENLKIYHPTSVLETGPDILFFWVARMILMTSYCLDTIPFHTVYLHGLVRDAKGQKMSKSLGNALDPLEIAQKYGADAGRMALIFGTAPGTDSKISEDKIKGQKHFANKLWNITRFVLSQENTGDLKTELKEEFDTLTKEVTADIEGFRLHEAAEKLYQYIWTRFADEILESSKKESGYGATLHYILSNSLKLLHPFMPFVTEALWELMPDQSLPAQAGGTLLMTTPWPQS